MSNYSSESLIGNWYETRVIAETTAITPLTDYSTTYKTDFKTADTKCFVEKVNPPLPRFGLVNEDTLDEALFCMQKEENVPFFQFTNPERIEKINYESVSKEGLRTAVNYSSKDAFEATKRTHDRNKSINAPAAGRVLGRPHKSS